MQKIFCVLFVLFIAIHSSAQTKKLFKIFENDKLGFIDRQGNVVISPKYKNGDDFSENLARVRLNGTYGFIDTNGNFVIPPQYDFAADFVHGIARVYVNGNPVFIDKNNRQILPPVYKSITFISERKAIVQALSGKKGIIDLSTRQLVADTAFLRIGTFEDGVAVVEQPSKKKNDRNSRWGVIDTTGAMIVPFDRYRYIKDFANGYAKIKRKGKTDNDASECGFIDTKGNFIFQCPDENGNYVREDFHNGLARIALYKHWLPGGKGIYDSDNSYEGYINTKGAIVLNDTNNRYVYDFSNGRAFIADNYRNYRVIDTKFNIVGKDTFEGVAGDCFRNGYAIVEKKRQWGIIDTNGKFVVAPQFEQIEAASIADSCFFYAISGEDNEYLYGIAGLNGKIITQPIIKEFDHSGFKNGLLLTNVNNRLTYFDHDGNIVWQEKIYPRKTLDTLDIDFMNRGYFYAHSEHYKTDIGGFGGSSNNAKVVTEETLPEGLSVTVAASADTFQKTYAGFRVMVANRSKKEILFSAQDSRLYMKVQAKDQDGKWKDIEYLPSSWCGNSYHTLTLEPDNYWQFETPVYAGSMKTKLRIELKYRNPSGRQEGHRASQKTIYSNEYYGSINPGQFSNKRTYYSGGLMDPYND